MPLTFRRCPISGGCIHVTARSHLYYVIDTSA